MKKYNQNQIDEFLFYLGYSVKEGLLEPEIANEIVEREDWQEVEKMMFRGDLYANGNN